MGAICILCDKQYLESLLKEMEDWKADGISVFRSGLVEKLGHGYIILEYGQPITLFLNKLKKDESILGYFPFGSTTPL